MRTMAPLIHSNLMDKYLVYGESEMKKTGNVQTDRYDNPLDAAQQKFTNERKR